MSELNCMNCRIGDFKNNLCDCDSSFYAKYKGIGTEKDFIDALTTKWIPVNERLPETDDWQIVTILDERGDTPFRYTDFGWYLDVANCWIVEAEQRTDVTAWMPLPEPWRGKKK